MNNQKGFVLITTIGILALITLLGIIALSISTTEVQISSNSLVYSMDFYAADSGGPVASQRLLDSAFLSEVDYGDPSWVGTETMSLSNHTSFTFVVKHRLNSDGEVLRFGDANGDHLWEINTTTGRPLELVTTDGTHNFKGGLVKIEEALIFKPAFELPEAALWVDDPDMVNFQGNASVIGDSSDESVCPDVPDMLHHMFPINPVDEPKHYGDEFIHEDSHGMYPFDFVKENLLYKADYVGDTFPTEIAEASSIEDPAVIILTGDIHLNDEDLKVPGTGVLFIDGNLFINGNFEWNGLVISTGSTSIGNGTSKINGTLVTGQAADVDISGTIVLQYDCKIMKDLFDNLSGYRRQYWRQL